METNQLVWDLSVPSVRDVEAPLGGTSTVYEIVLIQEGEQFLYTKTFREIEDFSRKLQKKFVNIGFPDLPTSSDVELKRKGAEVFLKFVAEIPAVVSSILTQQFIGQDRSIKQVAKDKPRNPILPLVAAVDTGLFHDQNSPYKESNLFDDDDSCDLFSTEPLENSAKLETKVASHHPKDQIDGNPAAKPNESDAEEDDHLFLPRKSTLVKSEQLVGETDDLFRVDDDLPDLFRAMTVRKSGTTTGSPAAAAKSTAQTPPTTTTTRVVPPVLEAEREYVPPARKIPQFELETDHKSVSQVDPVPKLAPFVKPVLPVEPTPEPKVNTVPEFVPKVSPVPEVNPVPDLVLQVKPVPPVKPVRAAKPVLPVKPVPPPKPRAVSLEQKPAPQEAVPVLDPVDIGSYIATAEMDSQREVSLFDD